MLFGTRLTSLPRPEGDDTPVDFESLFADRDALLDRAVLYAGTGALSARPVSTSGSPGIAGRFYIVNDQPGGQQIHFDYGTGWLVIPHASNPWVPLTLNATYSVAAFNGLTPRARLVGDVVHLDGEMIAGATIPSGASWATVPIGLRPSANRVINVLLGRGSNPSIPYPLDVETTGWIAAAWTGEGSVTSGVISLTGMSYPLS